MKKINIKSILLSIALISCINATKSQQLSYRNFKWQNNPEIQKLTPLEQSESIVMLREFTAIEYAYNEKNELEQYSFRHKTLALNDDKAVEMSNRIYIPASNPENLLELKARSISPTGRINELGKDAMKQIHEDGTEFLILALEGLEKGSQLEYYYLLKRNINFWGTEPIQSGYYCRQFNLQLISPERLVVAARIYNKSVSFSEEKTNSKLILQCTVDSIEPRYNEPYSANDANAIRCEYKISRDLARGDESFLTWEDAGRFQFNRLAVSNKDELKAVKKLSEQLDLAEKKEIEKISAIEAYIKTNIEIKKETDNENLKTILNNRYGNETGLLKLYKELFQLNNIRYELVLTCNRYERAFDPEFDSWVFLQEYLFYFPDLQKYLDPFAVLYRVGLIPYIYESNYGLFMKGILMNDKTFSYSEVRKIESTPVDEHYDNLTCTITPEADKATIDYLRSMTGHSAIGLRPYYNLGKEDLKAEVIKSIVQILGEEPKLSNIEVKNSEYPYEDKTLPFTLSCTLESQNIVEASGSNLILKIGEIIGPQVEMYSDKPRKSDVIMEFPHSYLRILKVKIPDGFTAKGMEKLNFNIVVNGADEKKLAGFVSGYQLEKNLLTITVNEYYNEIKYPFAQYEKFRSVINAAADFNKVVLVLQKN